MIADSLQAGALLEYVCRHPAEDDARLVYADWLEDHGGEEDQSRAAFIRDQIATGKSRDDWNIGAALILTTGVADSRGLLGVGKAVVRRGFIAEVSLTAESFAGGPCGRCQPALPPPSPRRCPACHGTGRTPGHAAALFRAAPIEKVTLSDRRPFCEDNSPHWSSVTESEPCYLPPELFSLTLGGWRPNNPTVRNYDTEQAALDALAAAALLLGRRRAWPCPRCEGDGKAHGSDRPFEWQPVGGWPGDCPLCAGLGHTVTA